MGWLIALVAVILFLILPLGVRVRYDNAGLCVYLLVGSIPLKVFPMKKRERKKKKETKTQEKTVTSRKEASGRKTGGSIKDFVPLVQVCLDFLSDFGKKLRVNNLEMKLILAGGDPSDLAINYGRAWAAVGNLMPRLEQLFVIKKRDVEVECDFTSDSTFIFVRLDISITVVRLLTLVVYYGIRVLREYMKIVNQRKGGARI